MRGTFITSNLVLLVVMATSGARAQEFVWAKQLGGVGTGFVYGHSIAVDSTGNVHTAGTFNGTADFDPGPDTYNLSTAANYDGVFVSKLDSAGNFVWAKQLGGRTGEEVNGYSIAVDSSGNVYTTG